jgi:hypothetical protein
MFISASIVVTNYKMNDNNDIPRSVTASGIFTRHLCPLDVEVAISPSPQSPEPCKISSGTRITGEPPFVY